MNLALYKLTEQPTMKRGKPVQRQIMRRLFSVCFLAMSAILLSNLLAFPAYGQEKKKDFAHQPGIPQDWSGRHVVYARVGPVRSMLAAQRDPRAILSWQASIRAAWHRQEDPRNSYSTASTSHRDWSIPLGSAGTAAAMYPAKFTFDINATPSCSSDFIVYPVNAIGSSSQPNIVAFNNLYSGTAGGIGACNRASPPAGDDGVSATTIWSYNVQGIATGGAVTTSPSLSIDGSRVAFVESATGSPAHFHVLAPKNGDGVGANLQLPAAAPETISAFSSTAPAVDSGTATDLVVGSTASDTNTLSSPFVDYVNDVAYVGNDNGTLFRIKDIFCTVSPSCAGGTPPAPSIDTSWGTGGSVSVGPGSCAGTASSTLTGPVKDFVTGNIFVGCADGKLYGFDSTGAALPNPSVVVGNGTATGKIVDPPIVDGVNGFVYVVSGNSSGGHAVLVQAKTDLSAPIVATVGAGGSFNLHSPDFNDAYFSSGTSTNWLIYVLAYNATASELALYGVGFDASHNMIAGTPTHEFDLAHPIAELSPVTEFLNGATDNLFAGILSATPPNFASVNITTFPTALAHTATEGSGTSGIVIDNVSPLVQASSVYFSALGANTAVKLTQAGLN
jgi:hypothetical protein